MADTPRTLIRNVLRSATDVAKVDPKTPQSKIPVSRRTTRSSGKKASTRKKTPTTSSSAKKQPPSSSLRKRILSAKKKTPLSKADRVAQRTQPAEKNTPRTVFRNLVKSLDPGTQENSSKKTSTEKDVEKTTDTNTPRSLFRNILRTTTATGPAATPLRPSRAPSAVTSRVPSLQSTPQGDLSARQSNFQTPASVRSQRTPGSTASSLNISVGSVRERTGSYLPQPVRARAPRKRSASSSDQTIPTSLLKTLFSSFSSLPVSPEAFAGISNSMEVFMKQLADDLAAYTQHAKRSTIDEGDITLLLARQRLLKDGSTDDLHQLIRQHLPLEYVEQLIPVALANNEVIPPLPKPKRLKRQQIQKKSSQVE